MCLHLDICSHPNLNIKPHYFKLISLPWSNSIRQLLSATYTDYIAFLNHVLDFELQWQMGHSLREALQKVTDQR